MGDGELFLVHPVGGAVDYLAHLAVGGYLMLLEGAEIHPIEVVVAHKGGLRAVGTEGGQALLAACGQFYKVRAANVVKPVVAHAAVAVDGFKVAAEQYLGFILTEGVALHAWQGGGSVLCFAVGVGTAEGAYVGHLLARGVAVHGDAVEIHRAVVLAVGHRAQAADARWTESALCPDVLKGDILLLSRGRANGRHCCKCHKYK